MPGQQRHIPKDGGAGRVTVTIAATYRAFGAVTDTLPAGFGCASGGLDDEEVLATSQQVRLICKMANPSGIPSPRPVRRVNIRLAGYRRIPIRPIILSSAPPG